MLKNILNKLIKLAGHKFAKYILAGWCFLENIFFPFPSDAIVIPMSISKPKKWLETFFIATFFAFLGAIVAYGIGSFMFYKVGVHIFELSKDRPPQKSPDRRIEQLRLSLSEFVGLVCRFRLVSFSCPCQEYKGVSCKVPWQFIRHES